MKQPPSDPPTPPRGYVPPPQRNGPGDRLDALQEAVQLLTHMLHQCIAAAEAARNSSDNAVVASRDNAQKIGMLARDVAVIRADLSQIKRNTVSMADKIQALEKEDEKTAGRVSQAEINAALAKQTAEDTQKRPAVTIVNDIPTPPPPPMSEPPTAIKPFVSRAFYAQHRGLITGIMFLIAAIIALIQTLRTP